MPAPSREAIDTFVSITGASESVALRFLEECGGDTNAAVNTYFSAGAVHNSNYRPANLTRHSSSVATTQTDAGRSGLQLFTSAARSFRPSLLLDPNYRRDIYNRIAASAFNSGPQINSQQGDMSQAPYLQHNGWHQRPYQPSDWPVMAPVGVPSPAGQQMHGSGSDIEEEMIKAALEASKREFSSGVSSPVSQLHREDNDISRAISLSLKTAEEEKAMREQLVRKKDEELGISDSNAKSGETVNLGLEWTARDAKETFQLQEPASDDENTVEIVVRTPDGSRHSRRFYKSDKLLVLFNFIDAGGVVKPGTYRLVTPYPRRAFGVDDMSSTFNEVGLAKQETLFLELI